MENYVKKLELECLKSVNLKKVMHQLFECIGFSTINKKFCMKLSTNKFLNTHCGCYVFSTSSHLNRHNYSNKYIYEI